MKKYKNLLCILFLLGISRIAWSADTSPSYLEPGFSFSNGIFTHASGVIQGSQLAIFSPDLSLNYYIDPTQAIIGGIDLHLNLSQGQVGLLGIRAGYKWYYWGQGYYHTTNSDLMSTQTQQRFSSYVGGTLKRYAYFLSNSYETSGSFDSTGSFFNLDLIVGADYMLTSRIKATSAISVSVISLVATDDRIKMTDKLFLLGISFLY